MVKRYFSIIAATLLALTLSTAAFAAATVTYEQVNVLMPELGAVIFVEDGGESVDAVISEAYLDGEKLEIVDIKSLSSPGIAMNYYFLVDVSGSIPAAHFSGIKKSLAEWSDSLSAGENMSLITFGNDVLTVFDETASAAERKTLINALSAHDQRTRFFDAIDTALEMISVRAGDSLVRNVVITVSDGEDVYKGGSTKNEVLEKLKAQSVPIYAMCVSSASKGDSDSFGEFARSSGGRIRIFNSSNVRETFSQMRDSLKQGQFVRLRSKSGTANGSTKSLSLNMRVGSEALEKSIDVVINRAAKDTVPPEITSVRASGNQIIVAFSENVVGADVAENYKISAGRKQVRIVDAAYNNDDGFEAILTAEDRVYSGKYLFDSVNIYDSSMDKNALLEHAARLSARSPAMKIFDSGILWLLLFLILLIAAIVLIILKKQHKGDTLVINNIDGGEFNDAKNHIVSSAPTRNIQLVVDDGHNRVSTLNTRIVGSSIVGRSDMCDIYLDDKMMSRQHFSLECDDRGIFVTDLNSSNGTYVNGVRLQTKFKLTSGDVIQAGQARIVVKF